MITQKFFARFCRLLAGNKAWKLLGSVTWRTWAALSSVLSAESSAVICRMLHVIRIITQRQRSELPPGALISANHFLCSPWKAFVGGTSHHGNSRGLAVLGEVNFSDQTQGDQTETTRTRTKEDKEAAGRWSSCSSVIEAAWDDEPEVKHDETPRCVLQISVWLN